jgi:hypothetical protein
MRTVRIFEHISLDGVIPNSDEDGDFPYSDWNLTLRPTRQIQRRTTSPSDVKRRRNGSCRLAGKGDRTPWPGLLLARSGTLGFPTPASVSCPMTATTSGVSRTAVYSSR